MDPPIPSRFRVSESLVSGPDTREASTDRFVPNALCFGDDCPGSGVPCFVQIGPHGITLSFGADTPVRPTETLPFTQLAVTAGGLDHDQLVVSQGGPGATRTLYLKDPELIRTFRQAVPTALHRHVEQAAAHVRRMRHRSRLVWSVAGGAVLALLLGLWIGFDLLVGLAVDRIPVEWEQRIGEAALEDVLTHHEVIRAGPAVDAVQEMTRRLTAPINHNPYHFDVTVVQSEVVNAFALPGGYVVVFTGLMQRANSGEEVAGVLGHEVNHVLKRHGLARLVKQVSVVTVIAIVLGDQQGLVGLMRRVGAELLALQFGREQEREADLAGLELLYEANIDPAGMITFFQRLSETDQGRIELLSTHPMSRGRAERLQTKLSTLPTRRYDPFTFDWAQVQASLHVQR